MQEPKHETRAKKAKLAIGYITFGTLLVVWSVIWLLYLTLPADISGSVYLACGVTLSGIAVVLIGMKVGDIGKEANRDEEELAGNQVKMPPAPKSPATAKTDPSFTASSTPVADAYGPIEK